MHALIRYLVASFLALLVAHGAIAQSVRIKDLGKLQGLRENALVGQGIVTGLAGTGDSPTNQSTRQAISNMLSQFNIGVIPEQIQSRNVAMVMVTAALPAFARAGDAIDVSVTSLGDARSLLGGTLLLTPLRGPDGKVYALSQGALSVGGFRYDANGNTVQKNHPTVGAIPSGAVIEVGVVSSPEESNGILTFLLHEPDYTTADRIAQAVNSTLGTDTATARDAGGIDIRVPERDRQRIVSFVARLESISIQPDRRARVVLNERTGTLVSGGDVRIAPVSVSHGDLRVTISSETSVSQPLAIRSANTGIRTAIVTNSQLSAVEGQSAVFVDPVHSTVSDLVRTLARMRTGTRDIISILRAIKAAGALHAELIIQ